MFPFCTPWNHQKTYKMRTLGSNGLMKHQEAIFVKKLYQNLKQKYRHQKRWMKHLSLLYPVLSTDWPAYNRDLLAPIQKSPWHLYTLNNWSTSKTHFFQTYSTIGIKMIYICGSSIWSANKGKRPISKRWLQEKNAREISR